MNEDGRLEIDFAGQTANMIYRNSFRVGEYSKAFKDKPFFLLTGDGKVVVIGVDLTQIEQWVKSGQMEKDAAL